MAHPIQLENGINQFWVRVRNVALAIIALGGLFTAFAAFYNRPEALAARLDNHEGRLSKVETKLEVDDIAIAVQAANFESIKSDLHDIKKMLVAQRR